MPAAYSAHRDLTVNNVLFTSDMWGKISDLDIAKILGLSAAQRQQPHDPRPGHGCLHSTQDVKVDVFPYEVMMVHALSGHWFLPGKAILVNLTSPQSLRPVVTRSTLMTSGTITP